MTSKMWKSALRYPTEDTFRPLLFEIAGLISSMPLTYASSDPEDFRPIIHNELVEPEEMDERCYQYGDRRPT